MKPPDILHKSYVDRLEEILDISWRLFKTRFSDERHKVLTEAPFQHHFAHIVSTVGELFCSRRNDIFLVDLETKLEKVKGKTKYIDITGEFEGRKASCAIELKFKTDKQGAQDHGRIDVFVDIEALEIAVQKGYSFGRFYMITDSTAYVNQSKKGVGTVFTTNDGAVTQAGATFHCPTSKGRENVRVKLRSSYQFQWEKIGRWYFLQLDVH